jgi:pilus assembly protein Flp/PilA
MVNEVQNGCASAPRYGIADDAGARPGRDMSLAIDVRRRGRKSALTMARRTLAPVAPTASVDQENAFAEWLELRRGPSFGAAGPARRAGCGRVRSGASRERFQFMQVVWCSALPVVHDSANLPRPTSKIRGSVFTNHCEFSVHNPSSVGGTLPITLGEQSMSVFKRFLRDESGATAIEYGLIAAGISVAIIATVNTLGGQLKNTFSNVSGQLGNAGK